MNILFIVDLFILTNQSLPLTNLKFRILIRMLYKYLRTSTIRGDFLLRSKIKNGQFQLHCFVSMIYEKNKK